jgi:hypothetical protein
MPGTSRFVFAVATLAATLLSATLPAKAQTQQQINSTPALPKLSMIAAKLTRLSASLSERLLTLTKHFAAIRILPFLTIQEATLI